MPMPMVFTESSAALASVNDATQQHPLGTLAWNYDSTFKSWQLLKYVLLDGAASATAGSVATPSDQGYGRVSVDRNGDCLSATIFGGVFLGSVTYDRYGWVCVGGVADVQTTGTETLGPCKVHSVDSQCTQFADGTEELVFGDLIEESTTSAATVACQIRYIG